MSRSGVLLRTDAIVETHIPIEIMLELPEVLAGEGAAHIVCKGEVVRSSATGELERGAVVAASIDEYHFSRKSRPS